jgi:hypothetical protein
MRTQRQYTILVQIHVENSEEAEYFMDKVDGKIVLDTNTLSKDNHEIVDWEEIDPEQDERNSVYK